MPGQVAYRALSTDDAAPRVISRNDLPYDDPWKNRSTHFLGHDSCFKFVEAGWFQTVTALIIVANIVTMVMEAEHPDMEGVMRPVDYGMLTFYIFEFGCRWAYFGRDRLFCRGPWGVLDFVVIAAGLLDEWLLPFFPTVEANATVQSVLQVLRFLRIFRVLKVVRIFMEADLSWTEEPMFQSFIGGVITVNSLLMGMETDIKWHGWMYIEQVLLTIYVFELSVRLKRFGCSFISLDNPDFTWNTLDFIIVTSSVMDTWIIPLLSLLSKLLLGDAASKGAGAKGMSVKDVMMLLRMLRLMRILRLVKLVKSVRPLFVLVTGVMAAVQGIGWVLVLTVVTLYALAIVATRLLGQGLLFPDLDEVPANCLEPFLTVPDSMFTLFRVMSGASSGEEQIAIDELMEALPTVKFGFVFFMVTSSWTLLSILTAVVSENMITTTGEEQKELQIQTEEEDRTKFMEELRKLFDDVDHSGTGFVTPESLDEWLAQPKNSSRASKVCRVPKRDIREVMLALSEDGEEKVTMETFIGSLVVVGQVVTEKSVMKIESRMRAMEKKTDELFHPFMEHMKHQETLMERLAWQIEKVLLTVDGDASPQSRRKRMASPRPGRKPSFLLSPTAEPEGLAALAPPPAAAGGVIARSLQEDELARDVLRSSTQSAVNSEDMLSQLRSTVGSLESRHLLPQLPQLPLTRLPEVSPGSAEAGARAPCCPDCRRTMAWSDYIDGAYHGLGYKCSNVARCGVRGSGYRWLCKECGSDLCEACGGAAAPSPQDSGDGQAQVAPAGAPGRKVHF